MNGLPMTLDVERFRGVIARRLGLHYDDGKLLVLADLLRRRAAAHDERPDDYVRRLERATGHDELIALTPELTIGETYFFRNIEQFRAFAEIALPERLLARDAHRALRILSAGCASGEEAFTIAMLVQEAALDPSWQIAIRAVDVNRASLERAARGRYSDWSLRATPPDMRHRWLRRDGRDVIVADAIRGAVVFEQRNLADDDPALWAPASYDVIFCRNVLMYFTPDVAAAVTARIASALAPGGFLFLGHAETLRGFSHHFRLCHTHATFYYQAAAGTPTTPSVPELASSAAPTPPVASRSIDSSGTWADVVRRAGDRIAVLSEQSSASSTVATTPTPWTGAFGAALDLLREERYAEALHRIEALPEASAGDPDVVLLHAVLLTHRGDLSSAEAVCARLLALDELHAGAHYVMALCRAHAGDRAGATDHDQVAAYLDPGFAMPRLHLGLAARRAGELDAARRELGHALVLLQREDASRVLLFGGGFSREALLGLCRAELSACGSGGWRIP